MNRMTTDLSYIALALCLVLGNAFFVAAEFSLVRIRVTRLDQLSASGNRRAIRAREMVKRINDYLSACQLGITLASLALGWIGEPAFSHLIKLVLAPLGLDDIAWIRTVEVVIAFAVITYLHLLLGEIVPKSLALQYTEEIALATSWPMSLFFRVTRPFNKLCNWSYDIVQRALNLPPPEERANVHSPEELRLLLHESHRSGTLTLAERELLENAFDFSDRTVRQVMRPRGEIAYLSIQESLEKSLERAKKNGYTRYPLCADDVDHVVGLIHVKDLLWPEHELKSPKDLVEVKRDILFVPEMIGIPALLTEMRRKKVLMAIAVDEYGVVSGICTMEDILEELVGEIQDEFDQEHPEIRPTKDGGFLVEGTVLIEDLNRRLLLAVSDQANDTVSGHILSRLGRMASAGDSLNVENYLVRIVEVKNLRISKLLFTPIGPRPAVEAGTQEEITAAASGGSTTTPATGAPPAPVTLTIAGGEAARSAGSSHQG
jgi:CBS domain containing-hemolysin-like protein